MHTIRPIRLSMIPTVVVMACTPAAEEDPFPEWANENPFADRVVSFEPGEGAGFGQDLYPDVVLGAPQGRGENAGSLHVLSLGEQGEIVVEFTDWLLVDGPGDDLIVFENAFSGWLEFGEVSASVDGNEWFTWLCDPDAENVDDSGCAGVNPVVSHPDNGIDPTDPTVAGGDTFDLADLGIDNVRFVAVRDTGVNPYDGVSGGFDLDALAIIHWADQAADSAQ